MLPAPIRVAARVAAALEDLKVPYLIGGSFASSTYGIPRATQDVDIVADLRENDVAPLVRELEAEFYADVEMMRDAVRQRSSFNVIHLSTSYKVDVFIFRPSPWAREEMVRRREVRIGMGDEAITLFFCSAEDTTLHKLEWYRAGGGVSDRQWGDVLGVLKVQGDALDFAYLRRWAGELGLKELLDRAFDEAGLIA